MKTASISVHARTPFARREKTNTLFQSQVIWRIVDSVKVGRRLGATGTDWHGATRPIHRNGRSAERLWVIAALVATVAILWQFWMRTWDAEGKRVAAGHLVGRSGNPEQAILTTSSASFTGLRSSESPLTRGYYHLETPGVAILYSSHSRLYDKHAANIEAAKCRFSAANDDMEHT